MPRDYRPGAGHDRDGAAVGVSGFVTSRCIDAGSAHLRSERRRADMCELVARHGFDPHRVAAVAYGVVDMPLLAVESYRLNEQGRPFVDDDGEVVKETAEVALRGDLPKWWRP